MFNHNHEPTATAASNNNPNSQHGRWPVLHYSTPHSPQPQVVAPGGCWLRWLPQATATSHAAHSGHHTRSRSQHGLRLRAATGFCGVCGKSGILSLALPPGESWPCLLLHVACLGSGIPNGVSRSRQINDRERKHRLALRAAATKSASRCASRSLRTYTSI